MDSNIVASSPFLRLAGLWTRDLPFRQTSILFSYRAVGRSENLGRGQVHSNMVGIICPWLR